MRIALTIIAGFLLSVSFAIAGGLIWVLHPTLRNWPLADGYSPVAIGAPIGGALGLVIWSAIRDKRWTPASMILTGLICSLIAFPGFHEPRTWSDGWDSLRAELTSYFWIAVFTGSLCVLFSGVAAHFRENYKKIKETEQGGSCDAEEAV